MKANVPKQIDETKGKLVFLAFPNTNDFEQNTVMTMFDLALFCNSIISGRAFIDNCLIHVARRIACELFLEQKEADYLFFVDSDNAFKPDVLFRLMEHDKDICSGLYFQRKEPFAPIAFKRDENGYKNFINVDLDKGLTEVDAVGMGCCLIKRRVVEKMFDEGIDWWSLPGVGEDIAFCQNAKEHGFKVYVDSLCKVDHIGRFNASESYFKTFREHIKEVKEVK